MCCIEGRLIKPGYFSGLFKISKKPSTTGTMRSCFCPDKNSAAQAGCSSLIRAMALRLNLAIGAIAVLFKLDDKPMLSRCA